MSGVKDTDIEAAHGTADDLTHAHPELASYLSRKHLGRDESRLSSEDAHRLAAKIERDREARERG